MRKLLGNLYVHGLSFRPIRELTATTSTLQVPQALCKITCSGTSITLSTLTAGDYTGLLFLIASSSEHRIILKDDLGNIRTPSGLDFELPTDSFTLLIPDGSNWKVVKPPSDAKFDTYMPDPLLWSTDDDGRILVANVVTEGGTFQNDTLDNFSDNLVAAFPLDELLGTRYDQKGEFDLVQAGQVASVGGYSGYAAWFDGSEENYLSVENFLGSSGTISFWMQASASQDSSGNILYVPGAEGQPPLFYITYNELENKLLCGVSVGGAPYGELEADVEPSAWVHVAFVWNPAGRKVYINGTLVDEDEAGQDLSSAETLAVGKLYKGALDDLYIWNAVLSEEAIETLSGKDGGGGGSFVVASRYVLSSYKVSDLLPSNVIDDTAGETDNDKTWSASKLVAQFDRFSFVDTENFLPEDQGKPVVASVASVEFGYTDPLIQAVLSEQTSHFELDERSGPRISEIGTASLYPYGTVEQITGKNGLAALFDGSSYLYGANYLTASGSLAFWFYVDTNATGILYLAALFDSADDMSEGALPKACVVYSVPTSTIRFGVQVEGVMHDLETSCTKDAWHHVCITWTAGTPGSRKLYLDGALKESENSTFVPDETDRLRFGYQLLGRLDTLQSWEAVLTEQVVAAIYGAGEGVELVRGAASFVLADNPMSVYDDHIADTTKHRQINDAGSGSTDLWSAARTLEEIDTVRILELDLLALPDDSRLVAAEVEAVDFGFQEEVLDASNDSLVAFNLNERTGLRRAANTEDYLTPLGTVEACTGPDRYAVLFDLDPAAYLQANRQMIAASGTVSMWFLVSTSDSGESYLFRAFQDDGEGVPEGLMHMYLLYSCTSRTLRFGTVVDGIYMDLESEILPPGSWVNVVCTWGGAARALYVNGVLAEQDNLAVSLTGADTLRFGEALKGRMDAVYVWTSVLSQAQITLLQDHFYIDTESHLILSELRADDIITHMAAMDGHVATANIHNVLDDGAPSATQLWSSLKISSELSGKAALAHTHATYDEHLGTGEIHRSIDDSGSTAVDLWSAEKILSHVESVRKDLVPTIGLADDGKLAQFQVDLDSEGFDNATLDAANDDLLVVFPLQEESGYRYSYFGDKVLTPNTTIEGITGVYGIGLNLSAPSQELSTENFITGTKGTLAFWFKPGTWFDELSGGAHPYILQWKNAGGNTQAYFVYNEETHTVRFGTYVPDLSTGLLVDIEGEVNPSIWSLVVLTWNGDAKKLYINGVLVDFATEFPVDWAALPSFVVGGGFVGRLDELYVWETDHDSFPPLLWNSGSYRCYHKGGVTLVPAEGDSDRQTSFTVDSSAMLPTPAAEAECGDRLTLGQATLDVVSFYPGRTTGVEFKFVVPYDWAGGAITLTPYWKATGTGSIKWQTQYCLYASGVSSFEYTTAETKSVEKTSDSLQKTSLDLVPADTPVQRQLVVLVRLYRVGSSDTLTGTANLLSVELKCALTPKGD